MNTSVPQRIFGLPASVGRWIHVLLGLLSLLCMGTAYSWTIFRAPLQELFGIQSSASLAPFTVLLVCYAVCMPLAGPWIERLGPRPVMVAGGLLVGLGYFLAGFATSITGVVVAYGILAGAGVGIAYGVPLAVSARWFPDQKGLALGITVIGFGLSPLVTAPLAKSLILAVGPMGAFQVLGILFTVLILLVAALLRFPPPGWHPRGIPLGPSAGAALAASEDRPLWKRAEFRTLWICYAIGTFVGLSAIGITSSVGREIAGLSSTQTAGLVSLFAVFNGLGRPLFGTLTDRLKPARAAVIAFAVILLACGLIFVLGQGRPPVYIVGFCMLWMCLGGWLAIAPTATAAMVPLAEYARTYGIVFTAYGVGALLGTLSAGSIRDLLGSYRFAFVPMAVLALAGLILAHKKLPK